MVKRKQNLLITTGFFLLNLLIKIYFLDKSDIALDEPFSIFHAQMGIREIIQTLTEGNNPPLFEIILHYWIKIGGIGPFWVRLLPAIFSSCTVVFIYLAGWKFYSRGVACIASSLFTISNFQIDYSHEVRVYSLFILLSSISLYLFLSLSVNKEAYRKLKYTLFIGVNLLLIYGHYFGFFVILVELIATVIFKPIRTNFLKLYLVHLFLLLVFFIPLSITLIQRFIASSHGTWVSPPGISSIYDFVWKLSNAPVTVIIILLVLLSSFLYWVVGNKQEKVETPTKVLLLWFFFPLFFSFAVSFMIPIFLDRYLVYISIGYYLLAAISVSYLRIFKYSSAIIACVIIIAMLIPFNPNYGDKANWSELVNEVKKEKTNETLLIIYPEWLDLAFTYHYNTAYFKEYSQTRNLLNKENIFPVIQYNQLDSLKVSSAKKLLFIDENGPISPDDKFLESFKRIFPSVQKLKPTHGPTLYIFSK